MKPSYISLVCQVGDAIKARLIQRLGVTSRLHAVNPCFLRSGRLDDIQEIIINTPAARYEILDIMTQSKWELYITNLTLDIDE